MTGHELRDRIRSYIVATYLPHEDPASLKDDTPLITGGVFGEQGVYDLLEWIEAEFGFEPNVGTWLDAIEHMDSVESIAKMIEWARARTV